MFISCDNRSIAILFLLRYMFEKTIYDNALPAVRKKLYSRIYAWWPSCVIVLLMCWSIVLSINLTVACISSITRRRVGNGVLGIARKQMVISIRWLYVVHLIVVEMNILLWNHFDVWREYKCLLCMCLSCLVSRLQGLQRCWENIFLILCKPYPLSTLIWGH